MTTEAITRQIRFFDLARAMQAIAARPDLAVDLAMEVDGDAVRTLESNLHSIVPKLNGDPLAAEIEALLNHPFADGQGPAIIHARDVQGDAPRFAWKAIPKPGGLPGDKNAGFECTFNGVTLKIVKLGPANYEGFVGGKTFAKGKFKKNLRERLEKEATRRAG